jgi:hypothetical protein
MLPHTLRMLPRLNVCLVCVFVFMPKCSVDAVRLFDFDVRLIAQEAGLCALQAQLKHVSESLKRSSDSCV